MKRKLALLPRILVCGGIAAFLALSPGWILAGLSADHAFQSFYEPPPAWRGVIRLWHIADFRTYQGKVTGYLIKRADAYEKSHPGVHIQVSGLTREDYLDRTARGFFPDAYSFMGGLLYPEQLQGISPELPALSGCLGPAAAEGAVLAAPYLMSGYFLAGNTQRMASYGLRMPETPEAAFLQSVLDLPGKSPELFMDPIMAARLGLTGTLAQREDFLKGRAAVAVVDARTLGDLLRSTEGGLLVNYLPFPDYTDQVFYLGVARDAGREQAEAFTGFMEWMLSEPEQRRLTTLGALPVAEGLTGVAYTDPAMEGLYASLSSPVVPQPFLYQRHRESLLGEAALALEKDSFSAAAFFQRMQVVESWII